MSRRFGSAFKMVGHVCGQKHNEGLSRAEEVQSFKCQLLRLRVRVYGYGLKGLGLWALHPVCPAL